MDRLRNPDSVTALRSINVSRRSALRQLSGGLGAALALASGSRRVAAQDTSSVMTSRRDKSAVASEEGTAVSYFDLEPDLRLHYDEQGEGRPVVFLPGWTGSTRAFRHQLSLFAPQHRAIALDYRSHGQSTQTLLGHNLAGYASDLRAFL